MWRSLLVGLVVSGCQCARLPDDLACEPDDPPCDASDAGDDAGVLDAGEPDAGPLAPCNDWACVLAGWTPIDVEARMSMTMTPHAVTPNVDGGALGWYGGVLLPDGQVLAVPHTADSFLVFDPLTKESSRYGPDVGATKVLSAEGRKFAGGVLVDRRVYVFPYGARHIHELNLDDGGFRPVGPEVPMPPDGGGPRYVGGVVDKHGDVWSVSEDALPVIRLDRHNLAPDGGMSVLISTSLGGYWGMVRLPDDRLLAFPKFPNDARLSRRALVIDPDATTGMLSDVGDFVASNGFQGASLTASGQACAGMAWLGTPTCVSTSLLATGLSVGGSTSTFGFNATGPDGLVWFAPDHSMTIRRVGPPQTLLDSFVSGGAVGRYTWLGLVATPNGFVAIPGEPPHRFGFLETTETRRLHVLLSPYFNKL